MEPPVPELMKVWIDQEVDRDLVPAGAVVGGADDPEQQQGVVSLMDAGYLRPDYTPITWKRIQVRCMGATLYQVDKIGRHVEELLDVEERQVLPDSDGTLWLVHGIFVQVGPSHHFDSKETLESLMFAGIGVGREPVGTQE